MGSPNDLSNFLKPIKWLLFALGVKLALYSIFILPDPNKRFIGPFIKSSDHGEYIKPIDNLFETGTYSLDGSSEAYAGRLPGFVFPYMIFRSAFNETTSNVLLGVFILILSVIASYVFCLLLFELTKKRWAFIVGFLLMNFAPFFWHYDWTLHPNSVAGSCLIFFTYFLYKYSFNFSIKNLILSGFFLAWLVLLRGFCLVFIPIIILFLFYLLTQHKKSFTQIIIASVLFLLPLSIFESAWVTRNYISLHKFIPLQTSFVPGSDSKNAEYGYRSTTKYSLTKVRELIFAWGGENAWYFSDSEFSWFGWYGGKSMEPKFSESIFYDGFNLDTLGLLRNDILYSYRDSLTLKQHDSIESKIVRTSIHLKEKFISNKKLYYYFNAPIKKFKNYVLRNVTQDWPGSSYKESNIFQKIIKLASLFVYFLLLLQIILFPVLLLINRFGAPKHFYVLFYVLILATLIPFMYFIVMSHFSYFIFGYILLIPLFIFTLNSLTKGRNG